MVLCKKYILSTQITKIIPNIHSDELDLMDTWKAMEQLVVLGLTRMIGVCNFNVDQLNYLINNCWIKPVVHSMECSPSFRQPDLLQFCKEQKIKVFANEPFQCTPFSKGPKFLFDKGVEKIALKHNKTTSQIVLRYLV